MTAEELMILEDTKAITRFWNKVKKPRNWKKTNQCWSWTAYSDRDSCGKFPLCINGEWKIKRAPRIAWVLHTEQDIPEGMCISHICDNPNCTRQDHLFLTTQAGNMADRWVKGRYNTNAKGETHPKAILTEKQVHSICSSYFVENKRVAHIAAEHHVSPKTIRGICDGRAWKHIVKLYRPYNFKPYSQRIKERDAEIVNLRRNKKIDYDTLALIFKMKKKAVQAVVHKWNKKQKK